MTDLAERVAEWRKLGPATAEELGIETHVPVMGRPRELEDPVKVTVKVESDFLSEFDDVAKEHDGNRSKAVRRAMREYVERRRTNS